MSPRRSQSGPRRALKRTVLVVLTLGIINYAVLPQIGDSRESVQRLRDVNPLLFLLAVGLEVAALLAYTILTKVTLPEKPQLSLFTIFRIQLSTKAVTNVVPGGSAVGGTLGYRLYTEAGVAPTAAGFTMATVGLGSAVVLNLILWLSLLVSIPINGYSPAYLTAAIIGAVLLAGCAALVLLLMEGRDTAERVLRGIARRIPRVEEETASRFIHQLADRLYDLARQPELIRRGVLWATANWLLDVASLWVFLWAFGFTVNPINLLVAYGVLGVVSALPLTPGGLGAVEYGIPTILSGFGEGGYQPLFYAVLAWRFAQFWLPIPLGGIAYVSLKFGPEGRRRRVRAMRDLAESANTAAQRRVWDEQTGEYRMVSAALALAEHLPTQAPWDQDGEADDLLVDDGADLRASDPAPGDAPDAVLLDPPLPEEAAEPGDEPPDEAVG